ncbi:uncharacterized protein LOC102707680 [Oryza brachyantha]|uniref:uncharacterized protein LOC102707680 n=1 Tax=Oryza brachyantha TaxID=4533 RepID=UPI001ADA286C|nr:uncharacterized protein LOC102707680 [Oryza brachyantha]
MAAATTAMTIDFLRARLLSERSVSRAAKERADQLTKRVAELEEQLRAVTAQRRKAERAAGEVLAILESQGLARFSDAADSGSGSDDDEGDPDSAGSGGKARGEAEDALSGSELGGTAVAAQPGGLSWKGRAASHDSQSQRRQQQQQQLKGRQLRQRHSHRRGYFYLLTGDSSPKYQPGQSCRKVKRKELSFQTEGEEGRDNVMESTEEGQERSDCTVCTDDQPDMDDEVCKHGPDSFGDGRDGDNDGRYTVEYEKDREMERVLEKQAELIGQFEAEENAQREWEKKFNISRDSTADDVELGNKLNQIEKTCGQRDKDAQINDTEVSGEGGSSNNNLFANDSPSECLSTDSVSGLPPNAPEENAIEQNKITESDHDFGEATSAVVSVDSGPRIRRDELVNKSCTETIEGSANNIGKSLPSQQGNYNSSRNAMHYEGQVDESSDSGPGYLVNACSSEHYINTPSVASRSSDTPKSKVSEWSSSCFHNHTDNQIDTQMHQPSSDGVGGVLDALQRAKISLREKLRKPSPPTQCMLALPAPEYHYAMDDLTVKDRQLSLCTSRLPSQDILALPEPEDCHSRILPRDDLKVPVGLSGLFRLPTDSFAQNDLCPADGYGSRFCLTATTQENLRNHFMANLSISRHGSEFSPDSVYNPRNSILLSIPTYGGCSNPVSDFTVRDASVLPEIPRSSNELRRGMPYGDLGMFHFGGDYSSNKWTTL